MNRKPFFPEPLQLRRQFGNPDRPLWGKAFDQFNTIPRKELNQQVKDTIFLVSNGDKQINYIAKNLSEQITMRGFNKLAALEVLFRIGALLNEIGEAKGG